MEEKALAVQEKKDYLSVIEIAPKLQSIANMLSRGGMFPQARNPAQIFCIIQYGAEVGIPPVTALQNIAVIKGRIAMNGQLMLTLARRAGVKLNVVKSTDQECVIEFIRGDEKITESFTIEEAKRADLLKGDNWEKYPKDMLFWRTVARGVRRIASDACMGAYLPDEVTEGEAQDIAEMEIVEVQAEQVQRKTEEREPTPEEIEEEKKMKVLKRVARLAQDLQYSPEAMKVKIKMLFQKESSKELTLEEAEKLEESLKVELEEQNNAIPQEET